MKTKLFLLLTAVSVLSLVGCDKKNKNEEEKKEKIDDLNKNKEKVAIEDESIDLKNELGYGK